MASSAWTNNGQAYVVDCIDPATRAAQNTTFHGNTGSATAVASPSDTALTENAESRATATVSQPASDTVRFVFSITFTGNRTVNEAGIFTAATGGILFARGQHATLNVESSDQVTYTFNLLLKDSSE